MRYLCNLRIVESYPSCDNQAVHRVSFVATCLFFILFEVPVSGQSLQARADEIRTAMEARDYDRAESLAIALRAQDPVAFHANNYDYLLGRLAERRGALAEAASLYQGVLNRGSNLAHYAVWHLSTVSRASGDLAGERRYLTRLLGSFSSSSLSGRARARMVDSLIESGEHRAAIPLLRVTASAASSRGRKALAVLGDAYKRIGDIAAAREAFSQLISSGSRDDYALAAAIALDQLDSTSRAELDEFEMLRRARIYHANRHWNEARTHLRAMVERFPGSPSRAEALYQTGFSFYREDRFDDAVVWFQRAYSEFPAKREGEEGYYWVGTALQRAGRYSEAAQRYQQFLDTFPRSGRVESAYRNVIDCLRYAGNDDDAVEWTNVMEKRFAGKPGAVIALFNHARIELARNNFAPSLMLFTRLQARPISPRLIGSPGRGEAAFLRAYVIEQMGRLAEAARLYLSIPVDRDGYFGHRATERLRLIAVSRHGRSIVEGLARDYHSQALRAVGAKRYSEAKDAANRALRLDPGARARAEMLSILLTCYSNLPSYSALTAYRFVPARRPAIERDGAEMPGASHVELAGELIFLGLYDEGSLELRLSSDSTDRGDGGFSAAVHSNRGDRADVAIAYAEAYLRAIPQDYHLALLPRDLAELLYPAPYREAVVRYSESNGIDPRLVLAIARQESRFDPAAKSDASARGLLQFIPETAARMAEEEGIPDFDLDSVYDPDTAVRLATRYIGGLSKLFPENLYAVVAGYNAGEQNAERWLFRARSTDADRFVAEIAIPETKDYLAKVIVNYQAYKTLYTRDLKAATSMK